MTQKNSAQPLNLMSKVRRSLWDYGRNIRKKTAVKSTDTFLVYDNAEGVMQVDGSNVKESFRDATDTTLSQADTPADAKAVGDRFAKVEKKNVEQDTALKTKADGTGIEFFFDSAKGCLAARITK